MALTASRVLLRLLEHHQRSLPQIRAITATAGHFGLAIGVLADELALGLGTVGLRALPVATGVFAHGLAFRFGGLKSD